MALGIDSDHIPTQTAIFESWRDASMYLITSLDPLSKINFNFLHTTLAAFSETDNVWTTDQHGNGDWHRQIHLGEMSDNEIFNQIRV